MHKNALAFKLGTKTCLQATALVMAIMLASGFLAAIPTVQAIPSNNKPVTAIPVIKTALPNDQSAAVPVFQTVPSNGESVATAFSIAEAVPSNTASATPVPAIKTTSSDEKTAGVIPVVQTVPPSDDSMVLTFTAKVNKTEVGSFSVIIAKPTSFNENTTNEMADQIQLTEEQKAAIRGASTVEIMTDSGSYLVVEHWMSWYFIVYGAYCHMHLSAIDARNYDTAINAAIALFALLTVLLLETIVGSVVTACIAFALAVVKIDYGAMYDGDKNSDNSFDTWFEISYNEMYCSYKFMRTPHYLWFVTPFGAYIWSEPEHGSSVGTRHTGMGGGGRLYAR